MFIKDDLYQQIKKCFPIPCVDLVVINDSNEILMLRRLSEPAKGKWWFPGGRVYFMESRRDAAMRKLMEECGLQGEIVKEIGTYDLLLEIETEISSHAITTVFHITVDNDKVIIDDQSTEYAWKTPNNWLKELVPGFPYDILIQEFKDTI
ncbi:NUDIX domain-containing protein [bacterium]|nr:NUDIX domain-containing protein [bacterium]